MGRRIVRNVRTWVLVGDVITLIVVTLYGFASHQTLGSAGWRILTTFMPLLLAWLIAALPLGAYDPEHFMKPRQLWRPFYAMILAAPLATWLRAVWLGTVIMPVFVAVLAGVSALAILVWRAIFWFALTKRKTGHG
jgi:hypothetical protein